MVNSDFECHDLLFDGLLLFDQFFCVLVNFSLKVAGDKLSLELIDLFLASDFPVHEHVGSVLRGAIASECVEDFLLIDLSHGGVVKVIPFAIFKALDVREVVATKGTSSVDHDRVELVHELALL